MTTRHFSLSKRVVLLFAPARGPTGRWPSALIRCSCLRQRRQRCVADSWSSRLSGCLTSRSLASQTVILSNRRQQQNPRPGGLGNRSHATGRLARTPPGPLSGAGEPQPMLLVGPGYPPRLELWVRGHNSRPFLPVKMSKLSSRMTCGYSAMGYDWTLGNPQHGGQEPEAASLAPQGYSQPPTLRESNGHRQPSAKILTSSYRVVRWRIGVSSARLMTRPAAWLQRVSPGGASLHRVRRRDRPDVTASHAFGIGAR
jgi:hypothetical protein